MNHTGFTGNRVVRGRLRGVSLIEALVALAIAALLLLGLSQIFIGSKQAYSLQEGMSRSQENARFVFGTFESGMRMAGYFGCGNENASSRKFYNHLVATAAATPFAQRFQRPLEGFDAAACTIAGCSNDGQQPAVGAGAADWSPALPDELFNSMPAGSRPVAGSDILVLRVLSAESAPTLGPFSPTDGAAFTIAAVPGDPGFVNGGDIYAISNCRPRVDVFKAAAASAGTSIVTLGADNPYRCDATASTWGCTQAEGDFNQPPLGQLPATLNAEVHKAQYLAYYVALRSDGSGTPALFVQTLGGAAGEEIADGVESMQLTYGIDADGDGVADSGDFVAASAINTGAVPAACATDPFPDECKRDLNWRKVVSVHVALLMRGQDRAGGAVALGGDNIYKFGGPNGAHMQRPVDGRFRDVYETTIAVRNRLSSF